MQPFQMGHEKQRIVINVNDLEVGEKLNQFGIYIEITAYKLSF